MTTAPLTLKIYQYDSELASHLVGQQSLGAIVSGEMIRFYGLSSLLKMQQGQMNMFNSIMKKIEDHMGAAVTMRRDLYNYFGVNGKTKQTIDVFHTVKDADAEEAKLWAQLEIQNRN